MNKKGFFKRVGLSAIIVALTGLTAFAVPTALQNGDFSDGLNGWTVESGIVYESGGEAVFEEDFSNSSTLSQEFTIPDFAQVLSFYVRMETMGPESPPEVFTAYLYNNPTDLNPLITYPGFDYFFYMDCDWEHDYNLKTAGTFDPGSGTLTLDVSGFQGQNAYLVFNLESEGQEKQTSVYIDNVGILIPAPGALVLGLIGTGAVGLWRRFGRRA